MYGVCQQLLPQPFFILGDVSKAAPQGSGMCRGRRTADKQDGRLPDQNGSPAIGRQFKDNQMNRKNWLFALDMMIFSKVDRD